MPRTLTTAVTTASGATAGTPFALIFLDFPGGALRLSTGPAVTWDGNTYTASASTIRQQPSTDSRGVERAVIDLDNADRSASAIVLANNVRDSAAKIWRVYTDSPAADDPDLLFDGKVSHVPEIADLSVTVEVASRSAEYLQAPRVRVGEAFVGASIAPGERISWGNDVIEIERSL